MSTATAHGASSVASADDTATDTSFFGHPRGLSTLFFTEMWERFSFYGMRGFLIFYMTAAATAGGMGLDTATAAAIYGTYTSMVYLMSVPGGWMADRVLGQRRAVLYGGMLIASGHFALAVPTTTMFYVGLVLIVFGTGLLKPNISVIVGQLYGARDVRRDAAFSIFYMGINLGAFLGPLVTGYLAQDDGFRARLEAWGINPNAAWHVAFAAAGVGMLIGLLQYLWMGRSLGEAGLTPGGATTPALAAIFRRQAARWGGAALAALVVLGVLSAWGVVAIHPTAVRDLAGYSLVAITIVFFATLFLDRSWTREERARLFVIFVFFACASIFWGVFEQAGSTLNLFADRNTRNEWLGFGFPSSWFQALNALFIIVFAPVLAWLWLRMGSRQPSSPAKFAIGLITVGAGFLILVPAAIQTRSGILVTPLWLTVVYLVHTLAELCLSPVGLSSMTKLAPPRVVGSMMGVWFLGSSIGNFLAGQAAAFYEAMPLEELFAAVSVVPIVAGLLMLTQSRRLTRLMGEHT